MKSFTPFEYVLIDIAAQWGLDKLTFEKRIEWTIENFETLEELADERGHWKEKPLYLKGVMALRQIQNNQGTGHMIGFDAVCSGMQILSCISGCESGANATGMVDPDRRADAYTDCTKAMQTRVPDLPDTGRKDIKQAVMTCLYGSKAIPEQLFGPDTPELLAFYQSLLEIAPGACQLLELFKEAWQPDAYAHEWTVPDGHTATIPVTTMKETSIEIDELAHSTFQYRYEINEPADKGISLIANITHSLDAWVLRSLIRRCSYRPGPVTVQLERIQHELAMRLKNPTANAESHIQRLQPTAEELDMLRRYSRTGIADICGVDGLSVPVLALMTTEHLYALEKIFTDMLSHKTFDVCCVHDEFKCSPVNMNQLRYHYKEIMAELAESTVLDDILSQITGKPITKPFRKLSETLGNKIRQSNYAIC